MAELRLKTIDEAEIKTVFGEDFIFEGELSCDHPVLIKGQISGKVGVETDLYIHQSAKVNADIYARTVSIRGRVSGSLHADTRVELFSTGSFQGEVHCPNLLVQNGSRLNGTCHMPLPDDMAPESPHADSSASPRADRSSDLSEQEGLRGGTPSPAHSQSGNKSDEQSNENPKDPKDSNQGKPRGPSRAKPMDSLLSLFVFGLLSLFFLMSSQLLLAQTDTPESVQVERPDALSEWRQGNYERAVDITLVELQENPRNLNSYTVLGWALLDLGRYTAARDYSLEALQIARYDYRILGNLGEAYFHLGDNLRALQYLQEYVQVRPQGSRIDRVYYLMGEVFIKLEEYNRADIALTTAVFHNPQSASWWVRLGYAREQGKNFPLATRAYQEALNREPTMVEAQRGLQRVQQAEQG
jgi:cytoskeletal protein CcmA (bactofilin family)/Flp pilus assembly protein TadD